MGRTRVPQRSSKKKRALKPKEHVHIWDIPQKYFPRKTKAKEYTQELLRTTRDLHYTNRQVQYSAQICAFNIKTIIHSDFQNDPTEVFGKIREFAYHYENYCYRVYTYREKILQFVNAILPVGYTDKEVRIQHLLINPIISQAGILVALKKFKKNTPMSTIIGDRTKLTHRLYYEDGFDNYFRPKAPEIRNEKNFSRWVKDWGKQIASRAQLANKCTKLTSDINNQLAQKIMVYKDQLRKS